jgi:cupin fold WbuC family metalloprotein
MNAGKYPEIGLDVYGPGTEIMSLKRATIDALAQGVHQRARKRVTLYAHRDLRSRLHERFVVYVRDAYVRPNKHPQDASLHILHGEADFVFFDAAGDITDIIPLGPYGSGRQFYCRIPRDVCHTWVVHSDEIAVHKSSPGPVRRTGDMTFATWAPEEGDPDVTRFMQQLAKDCAAFLAKRS